MKKQHIALIVGALILLFFFFTREDSKFFAVTDDEDPDITFIEEKTYLDKINNNFKKVKEVLSAGTGENNMMSRVYYPEECGHGDRDRRRDRWCERRDETCFNRNGMHRVNCGSGMLIDLSSGPHRRCGCMYPMTGSSGINVNY